MATYLFQFDRIGRNHSVPELTVEAGSGDEMAEHVLKYARRFLASRDIDVAVLADDTSEKTGVVSIGFGRFGGGTWREVAA